MRQDFVFPGRVILANETQSSDDAVKVVKLPLTGYLHTLYVKVKCTNGATSALNLDMSDVVDKVEVVANGSDVIFSMTLQEIKRWSLWNTGLNLPQVRNHRANAVQEVVLPIMFGRMPFDPNYYLPCAKLTDLELRVAYSPTIGATAFVTGTTKIGVFALVSSGAQPGQYQGTLSTKTLRAFTSAASGDEPTLLPKGNPLRQVLVYAYEAAIEDGVDITNVKFDINNDTIVYANLAWNDLNDINKYQNWVNHIENIQGFTKDTDTIDTDVARIRVAIAESQLASNVTNDTFDITKINTIAGDRITIDQSMADITAGSETHVTDATLHNTDLHIEGEGLSHAVVIDFSQAGEQGLLNTAEVDTARLTLTQGGAGADVRISTQEVRAFGV